MAAASPPAHVHLTKPNDWTQYLIDAALKVFDAQDLPATYLSEDAGKLHVMKTLNFLEAHGQYDWPNFESLGIDFAQIMRLRRALVNDVFVSLVRNGNFLVGVGVGSPDSTAERRKAVTQGRQGRLKRTCRRDEDAPDNNSTEEETDGDEDSFLAQIMRELMSRSAVKQLDEHVRNRERPAMLASLIHDGLVAQWDRPQLSYEDVPENLQEKIRRWAGATLIPDSRIGTPIPRRASSGQRSSPELGDRPSASIADRSCWSARTVCKT